MAGYLDAYGASDARREKTIKWLVLGGLGLIVIGTLLYFQFRDFPQERQAKTFLSALQRRDYQAAYVLWGCTAQTPCRDYKFEKFLEDWGPRGTHARSQEARIVNTMGCDTGVLADLRFPDEKPVLLWVERKNDTVGFFPWKLRPVPDDFRSRAALWMWKVTRNCKPLIE